MAIEPKASAPPLPNDAILLFQKMINPLRSDTQKSQVLI